MGKLILYSGVMGSSKTTSLMQEVYNLENSGNEDEKNKQEKRQNKKVILMKPGVDTKGNEFFHSRFGGEFYRPVDVILPADKTIIEACNLSKVNILNYDFLVIDEAQFMNPKQVYELWQISNKIEKLQIICYSLITDFQANFFPGSEALSRFADEKYILVRRCEYCAQELANFNARKVNGVFVTEGDQVVIDNKADVSYKSLCGACYYKHLRANDDVSQQIDRELSEIKKYVKKK